MIYVWFWLIYVLLIWYDVGFFLEEKVILIDVFVGICILLIVFGIVCLIVVVFVIFKICWGNDDRYDDYDVELDEEYMM